MMKTLLFSALFALTCGVSGIAAAQDAALSQLPTGDALTGKVAKPSAARTYLPGSMPINMRPGAYIAHGDDATQAGRKSYPETRYQRVKPTSVQAYNQNRARARVSQQRASSGSLIPSPFPAGYGE